jgi:Flp pilus assembly protein TadG
MRLRLGARGTTGVEFAVVLPVTLIMVFAIIDGGLLFADQHALDYAVENAVRYAVVNSASATTTTITNTLVAAITPAVGATRAAGTTVSVTFSPSEKVGGTVQVSASLAWSATAGLDYLPAVTLSSSQTLTIQH